MITDRMESNLKIIAVISLSVLITNIIIYGFVSVKFVKQERLIKNSDVVEVKRISSPNSNGVYYFEYQGGKFILTSQGYVTQILRQD